MKLRIAILLLAASTSFVACKKESVAPAITPAPAATKVNATPTVLNQDTTSIDTTKGSIRIQLTKDSVNKDNIFIQFAPTAKAAYVKNEDATKLVGFGAVSLASLSSDNVALAINTLPLLNAGTTVKLQVSATADGIYSLNMSAIKALPSNYSITLVDSYTNTTVDLKATPSYAFTITNSDAASFGTSRFSIVIKK